MKSKLYYHYHGENGPSKTTGQNKKILNTLNDLIRINIDRIMPGLHAHGIGFSRND